MNIQPLKTVEDSWNDTLTENNEATFFDIVNSDRHQAYTSLIEGIEGKLYEAYCEKCDNEREYCDCTRDELLTDILENVVKPLYGKE